MKKTLLDPATGEHVEVLLIGKNPAYRDKGFVKVFVSFLRDVVEEERIAAKAIRLLLYAIDKLDWNSLEVFLLPEQVAQDLKITKRTYHRWIKDLLELGFFEKLSRYRYRLKPHSVVKGSMHKLEEVDF